MASISKMARKCQRCRYKDSCDNKKMESYAIAEMTQSNISNVTISNSRPLAQPLQKKHTSITIKMGEFGNISTSLEEIKENINKNFWKAISSQK